MWQRLLLLCVMCISVLHASSVSAQEQLTLSVTPPLYQINVAPGDAWKSSLKVINSNPYELTVYAQVAGLVPQGEEGQGRFLPREGGYEPAGPTLPSWIQVSPDPIVIAPEQSVEIPVAVTIPTDASPGGHFATILVGTQPPAITGSAVRTAQVVSALFFVRVAGDVQESGSIREFSVTKLLNDAPNAHFLLRFENTGNVHVQPQGSIRVLNMWGKERGVIPINQKSSFGNVLPQSIRKFEFTWSGERSLSDIGRYTAEVSLTYGMDARHNVSQITHFWVIPIKGALITLTIIGLCLLFVVWAVRRYVRRALQLAGYDGRQASSVRTATSHTTSRARPKPDLALPIREGVLDLRSRVQSRDVSHSRFSVIIPFVKAYKLFFVGFAGLLMCGAFGAYFFGDVLRATKDYEVTIERGGQDVTLSREEIQNGKTDTSVAPKQNFELFIRNETSFDDGVEGVAKKLTELGYTYSAVTQATSTPREKTVILFAPQFKEAALTLSNQLGSVPVSARAGSSASHEDIVILLGEDMVQ